ncbi:predicted protein [Sclerotinia sclerotiorum 1980 UF-70]|uniref:C2H2-type domain-containing protein n=1 Tax=Sclerotinia sclerotiorum (strain ATCC 18683 / 1980 / Ss-1) TaxID=665079 RepID=A7E8Q6_SCLS1|nr:predicted protein [Sclerotinia sclerotiorum 1980 UF-70]EDN96758.1 predicted protein [Sclerotinia sclerotiorum 1980 UF-70]
MDNDHPPASSDIASNAKLTNTAETPENTTTSGSSTRESPKGAPQAKSASGNRFQCPQCPKNFSRIENLTRHQANHDVVGKFACPICKKRFTRSDLLSRHRRIHNGPDKRAGPSGSHVMNNSVSPVASEPQPISNLVHHDEKSNNEFVSTLPPSMRCQVAPHDSLPRIQEALYSDSRSAATQSQGLSSLVEAALAPLPPDNSLHAPENFNPSAWDGFMLYNDNPSIYMGPYDADISWTLDCFSQDPLSNIDSDFGLDFIKSDAPGQSSDLDAEGDEEDWPDKVSRLETPPRWGPRVIPKLGPESCSEFLTTFSPYLTFYSLELGEVILDCQYASLFNVQPYISRAETTNCVFPCPEQHWEAPSPQAWNILLGPADIPPATYYLHALNGILLHKWTKPPPPVISTTVFGKTLVLYGIHTLIFDWRTSVSMLNPTGLMGTTGNHALDIGAGLLSRRKWLIDALDSWNECYGESSGEHSIAGRLLCALGYVSLDVSLSDVHLMAGRSSSRQDCEFAAVNLRYWANSDIVSGTMKHVYGMLNLSYECIRIRDGNVVDGVLGTMGLNGRTLEEASYEIALCLFTGGLVCWVYKELRTGLGPQEKEEVMEGIRRAGRGLRGMRCWRMAEMFGRILATFE